MLCIDGVWRSIQFSTIGASMEVRSFGCVWESGDLVDCSFVLGCSKSVVLGCCALMECDGALRYAQLWLYCFRSSMLRIVVLGFQGQGSSGM